MPNPDILANEIIENIESGLNSFSAIMETINGDGEQCGVQPNSSSARQAAWWRDGV